MAVKWPGPQPLEKNLEQETLLITHVNLSLTLSFFSEKLQCDQGYSGHNSEPPPQGHTFA